MHTVIKRTLVAIVAIVIAAIPTRLGSHDVAVGFPFTWYTRQEVITFGEQPHTFSFLLLLSDIAIALLVQAVFARLLRTRHP